MTFADLYTCYITGQMDVARYYQLRREQPLFARWVDRGCVMTGEPTTAQWLLGGGNA